MSDARSKARGRTTKPERIIHLSRGRHSPGKGLLRLLQLSTAGHLVEQDVSAPVEGEGEGGEWRGCVYKRVDVVKKENLQVFHFGNNSGRR